MKSEMPEKIGGVNHIVEIDESLFSKRKYNVGRIVRTVWVVGGIDMTTGHTFFTETLFRTKEALNQIILRYVKIGTTIYTNGWAGYNDLTSLGYIHLRVNHKLNFVDPITGVNTQVIEGMWSVFKRKLRARGITNRENIVLIFAEFLLKSKFKELTFQKILENNNDSLRKIDF